MKKVINVALGSRSFAFDEDAYQRMDAFLANFRRRLTEMNKGADSPTQDKEIMDDLEMRIGELLENEVHSEAQSVTLVMVNHVTEQLGMPDGKPEYEYSSDGASHQFTTAEGKASHKFYRERDGKVIGGVCMGLATYFDIDVVLVRILFVMLLITASAGFWIYLIVWIVSHYAETPAQECELRGIPATAENMAKYANRSK